MMESPSTMPVNLDFDLPCVYCGYNLRRMAHDGRCPECGLAVRETMVRSPNLWKQARAEQFAWAVGIMAFAGALPIAGIISCLVIFASIGQREESVLAAFFVMQTSFVGACGVHIPAIWTMASTPGNGHLERFDRPLRLASILASAGGGLGLIVGLVSISQFLPEAAKAMIIIDGVSLLAFGVYFWMLGWRLTAVCTLSGFRGLAARVRGALQPLGVCAMILGAAPMFALALELDSIPAIVAILLGLLGTGIFWIAGTAVLVQLYLRFADVARQIKTPR